METGRLNPPVEPLIARLYRSGLLVRAGNFRAWALRELRRVIPFDGALWGTGSMQRRQFHTVVTVDLPALAARLPTGAIRLGKRLSGLDTQGESYRLRFGDGTDE